MRMSVSACASRNERIFEPELVLEVFLLPVFFLYPVIEDHEHLSTQTYSLFCQCEYFRVNTAFCAKL